MRKADKTATKVVFIFVFAMFVIAIMQLLQFILDGNALTVTVSFMIGFFISYFGGLLEEKLYANSK